MSTRTKAILALATTTVFWAFPMLVSKQLTQEFGPWTQNFYRYCAAMVTLVVLAFFRNNRRNFPPLRRLPLFIIPAIPNLIHQSGWVIAMYTPTFFPGEGSLLQKSTAIFSAIFGYLFFKEERRHILSPRYIVGLIGATIGAVGVVLADPRSGNETHLRAALLVVFTSSAFTFYSISMKKLVKTTDPITAFTIVSVFTTIPFLFLSWWEGDILKIFTAPSYYGLLAIFSGILFIGVAHPLFFYATRELGVAVCNTVVLATAILTPMGSYLLYGEILTPVQILWGLFLLAGAAVTIPHYSLRKTARDQPIPTTAHGK